MSNRELNAAVQRPRVLVVVDAQVDNWKVLVSDLPKEARVLLLDPARDGVRQLADAALGLRGLDAIHIIGHGSEGSAQLGSACLCDASIDHYADALATIGDALAPGGDILLYGCEVGRGAAGAALVRRLAELTGADVAAATAKVGAHALGGDWRLDVMAGSVAADLIVPPAARQAYAGVLAASFGTGPVTDPLGDTHSTGVAEGRMVLGDYDNDGDVDILFQDGNTAGDGFGYFRNDGAGSYTRFNDANDSGLPFDTFDFTDQQLSTTGLFALDYDNDGDVDIVDRDPAGGLGIWRNAGGVFSEQADPLGDIHSTGAAEGRMKFGDFDNDGDLDVLFQDGATAGDGFGYFRNDGAGSYTRFNDANDSGLPFDTFDFTGQLLSTAALFVLDYDNDGDADIIDRDPAGGLSIWRNDSGVFSLQSDPLGDIHSTGVAEGRMIFGDFDSDGDVDALFQDGNTAGDGFGYFRNDGAGSFTRFNDANDSGLPFDTFDFTGQQLNPAGFFVADYDNDGDLDVFDREVGGGIGIWRQGSSAGGDGRPPTLVSSTPGDNATGVSTTANIVLNFSENVTAGAGTIRIYRTSDDGLVESITANDGSKVSGSGTSTITINPTTTLAGSTGYYVLFDVDALRDSDGMAFGVLDELKRAGISDKSFLNFTTSSGNTAPTLNANTGLTVNEGASATITATQLDFNDAEQADTAITYTLTAAATNGTLSLAGSGALGLGGTFTQDDINNNQISYTHDGGETIAAAFSFTVSDGAGGSIGGQTFTFTVSAIDDPAVVEDDAFTTAENAATAGANVFADNGAGGDGDPDNALTVTLVNGSAFTTGVPFALTSGALLTMETDGDFIYDPNSQFDSLAPFASGAINNAAFDTFTYTVAGGATATVTIEIQGIDSNDRLFDRLGVNDTLQGGIGDDWYFVRDLGDTIVEVFGNGNADRVFARNSYTLTDGAQIETFSTDNNAGTGAINLVGNELGNFIFGNEGINTISGLAGNDLLQGRGGNDVLNGGEADDQLFGNDGDDELNGDAGADRLYGGSGQNDLAGGGDNDWYFVTSATDTIVEIGGGGAADRVFTNVSYGLTAGAQVETFSTDNHAGTAALALSGNELANTILGNAGDNALNGGGGRDTLHGRGGANTFVFDTALGLDNIDLIGDFGALDRFELDDAVFAALGSPGALAAEAFRLGATAVDADDRILYDQTTGALRYDADGSGGVAPGAVFAVLVNFSNQVSASDFMVV